MWRHHGIRRGTTNKHKFQDERYKLELVPLLTVVLSSVGPSQEGPAEQNLVSRRLRRRLQSGVDAARSVSRHRVPDHLVSFLARLVVSALFIVG